MKWTTTRWFEESVGKKLTMRKFDADYSTWFSERLFQKINKCKLKLNCMGNNIVLFMRFLKLTLNIIKF